jgi:aminopeptidase-like protein
VQETTTDIERVFDQLWPIMRSITGNGVRETHNILSEIMPLNRIEVPSGSNVFDWIVPQEWVYRDAYVIDPNGHKILSAEDSTLHLLNGSVSFQGTVTKSILETHLYSLPNRPDAIPYVTSYYNPSWGFCLSQNQRDQLDDGLYQVNIDTDYINGSLTMSDLVIEGETDREVLISTYTCHPSLANNELSGPLAAIFLAKRIASWPSRKYTYRFVFCPETIGAITYLSLHGQHLKKCVAAGFVVTCVGLDTVATYQRSQLGDTLAEKAAIHALDSQNKPYNVRNFHPTGSDERQYCSPGFNLPVGSYMRGPYSEYDEYHTSKDNKDLISFSAIQKSINDLEQICRVIEMNQVYRNTAPFGEPNLGKRGLYPKVGGKRANMDHRKRAHATLWLCNQCDGSRDLIDISKRSGFDIPLLHSIAEACVEAKLFERV